MKIYGIDVSHHQGSIDWPRTAAELRRVNGEQSPGFAILRAGYSARHGRGGLQADGQILRNLEGCTAAGVPKGIYVYSYDQSPEAARLTAEQTLAMLRGYRYEYPIFWDVEYEPYNTGRDGSGRSREQIKADNTDLIRAALETFERAGYYAAVYCSRDFFLNYTDLSRLKDFDKWEAAYTGSDTSAVPDNGIWQYCSDNALGIAGFGSHLDCDVATRDYPAIMQAHGLNGFAKADEPPAKEPGGDDLARLTGLTGRDLTAIAHVIRAMGGHT